MMRPTSSNETVETQLSPTTSDNSVCPSNLPDSPQNWQQLSPSLLRCDEIVDNDNDQDVVDNDPLSDDHPHHHEYQHNQLATNCPRHHHHHSHQHCHHNQQNSTGNIYTSDATNHGNIYLNSRVNPIIHMDSSNNNNNNYVNSDGQTTRSRLYPQVTRVFGSNSRRAARGIWNSNVAPFFATLICCLNFYTICRFSILTYFLRGSFILQFMVISICFALPFLLFLMSIGQYLGSGFMDMWFISPIFKGIGIAFMLFYAIISIYSIVPISWLLVYLRDSFLTTRDTPYKWTYCNRRFNGEKCIRTWNSSSILNDNSHLSWSVSGYFQNTVMGHQDNGSTSTYAKLNVIMNLALLWILTFVILFRGLHNCGRIINFLVIFPLVLFLFVTARFIEQFGGGIIYLFFSNGKLFLGDSLSWILAARECFMVWTLFGGVIINVYGHARPSNLIRHIITLFIIVTVILISSACFFASTMQIIISSNLQYVFSSFEKHSLVNFAKDASKTGSNLPAQLETASNLIIGESLLDSSDIQSLESNYQVLRWATEVMPLALALKGPKVISSFWAMSFYLSGVIMNFAFHLVIWGSFIDAIIALASRSLRETKSTVAFVASFIGFASSVAINSWKNLHIIYFLDSCFGSIYWISCLYLVMVVVILVVRGKPCAPHHLVTTLTMDDKLLNWLLPTLTLHWTLILPILLMILTIFLTRSYRGLELSWSQVIEEYVYWKPEMRLFWNILAPMPLLIVVLYLVIRLMIMPCIERNLSIRQRLCNLFIPHVVIYEPELSYNSPNNQISTLNHDTNPPPDPPPKYSPPPSYSSATAKPIIKPLRARFASSITIDLHFLRESGDSNDSFGDKNERKKIAIRRKSTNKL